MTKLDFMHSTFNTDTFVECIHISLMGTCFSIRTADQLCSLAPSFSLHVVHMGNVKMRHTLLQSHLNHASIQILETPQYLTFTHWCEIKTKHSRCLHTLLITPCPLVAANTCDLCRLATLYNSSWFQWNCVKFHLPCSLSRSAEENKNPSCPLTAMEENSQAEDWKLCTLFPQLQIVCHIVIQSLCVSLAVVA